MTLTTYRIHQPYQLMYIHIQADINNSNMAVTPIINPKPKTIPNLNNLKCLTNEVYILFIHISITSSQYAYCSHTINHSHTFYSKFCWWIYKHIVIYRPTTYNQH